MIKEKRSIGKSEEIRKRAIDCANYFIEKQSTVRATADVFKVSKSTVHKDLVQRLPKINPELAARVREVINENLNERHIRGGAATKMAFTKMILKNNNFN